jgi:hypothetical protein
VLSVIVPEGDIKVAALGADIDMMTERPKDQFDITEVSMAHLARVFTE